MFTNEERRVRAADASRRWAQANPEKQREMSRLYRERNPEKVERIQRNSKMKLKYGITLDDYEMMLESQGGQCAICPATTPGRRNRKYLYVDHDHTTGRVRGLLCGNCNDGLGRFGDSLQRLAGAMAYLIQNGDS